MSPNATVDDSRWFVSMYKWSLDVITKTDDNAEMTAWGMYPGWSLEALNVTIIYANIELFKGSVSVFFEVPSLASGKFAVIKSPDGFELFCPEAVAGKPPPVCRSKEAASVNLTLADQGKEEGENMVYSFVIPMQTPERNPPVITWDVRIHDKIDNVVDGIVGLKKEEFVPGMYLQDPHIQWETPPQRGEFSDVIITVTILRRIWHLRALLVTMPEGYSHDIQHPNQFKSLTKTFPVAIDVPWRNYENLGWVRILIAKASTEVDFVPGGQYQFKYPVMLPLYEPFATEWYLSLCKTYDCESVNPPDPGVVISFPMPQPDPIAEAKLFGAGQTNGIRRAASTLVPLMVVRYMLLCTFISIVLPSPNSLL
jgi:hypothetical protein